jgi:hypothetical protein
MKTRLLALASVVLLASGAFAAGKDEGWTRLFSGKDLTGLKVQFMGADKGADPAKAFSVKDGSLVVGGKPTCYVCNGVPVSSGKTGLTSGPIGFQCEGSEVHFRNIQIKEMK